MAVSDYKTNPDENTTISGINIAEGCPPSGINNAIRQLMADVASDIMVGAVENAQGKAGRVPAPAAGQQNKPFTGGGKYADSIDCAASRLSSMYLDSNFQDTPDWWRSKGTSIFAVNSLGVINNQPNQYGTIINTVVGAELEQIFIVQPAGRDFYTRGANLDGWNGNASDSGTWHKISNSMPVGSVYVQLSSQAAPSDLFGGTWTNISSTYAGRFFRVEGGDAAAFGKTQNYGAPNITGALNKIYYKSFSSPSGPFILESGTAEAYSYVNTSSPIYAAILRYSASNANNAYSANEVRPYNSAIRIWKRTA